MQWKIIQPILQETIYKFKSPVFPDTNIRLGNWYKVTVAGLRAIMPIFVSYQMNKKN